ncbi:MAG TPA: right-handed parallel beta-helix repeat-containing protein, partial [Polyangiaceae bacterium]|nr:right-handed parallel beta-helix repeat-containing protein [Polyangiaceae bacterium]
FDDRVEIREEPCADELDGVCVGVDTEEGDKVGACPCSGASKEVADRAELLLAFQNEAACVTLADGHYGIVEVPDGFELVGASVDGVVLDWLSFVGGSASACRMNTKGVNVVGGASGRLQYLSVADSPADGVLVDPGGEAHIVGSTIDGSSRYGVSGFGAHSVVIERSAIKGGAGPGIWVACTEGCACMARPELVIRDSVVRENSVVGMSIVGADADLQGVSISRNVVGENFEAGAGISVSTCSRITAANLEIADNADFGLLIDSSRAEIDGIEVTGNLRGIFTQTQTGLSEIRIAGASVTDNFGVGLGISGATTITFDDSIVSDTRTIALPVLVDGVSAGAQNISEGICWSGTAVAELHRVLVKNSDLVAFVIDGPASGVLEDVTLPDGSLLEVNYTSGPQPMTSGSTPPIHTLPDGDSSCR